MKRSVRIKLHTANNTSRGSTLLLIVMTVCFVVLPAFVLLGQFALYQVDHVRSQGIVEAAGLVAANDLSRIIINDDNFGYVSLSNYPPIGKGTIAGDGEPLPVTGINTLVGTVRQNTIIAAALNNTTMTIMAEKDKEHLDKTIKSINTTLKDALAEKPLKPTHDIQGSTVETTRDVVAFIEAQLPANIKLESIKVSNGWLAEGGDTTIALPKPLRMAQVLPAGSRAGKYRAFTNVPVNGKSFTFAGLGSTSSTIAPGLFRAADDKHINSIVKIECTLALTNLSKLIPFGLDMGSKIQVEACCQPYSMPDVGPSGAMTLRFSSGPAAGMQSWRDFLNGGFNDNKVTTYDVTGGDYPTNHQATMSAQQPAIPLTTTEQFGEHLYYWLRNGHVRPTIEAVIAMVDESFKSGPNQIYAYEFAKDGSISRRIISKDPFPIGVTADGQMQTMADTNIQGGITPIIIFRDDVAKLSTTEGGIHGGQPLAGTPLNWCELPEYGGDEQIAAKLNKGHLGTKLTLSDPSGHTQPDAAINDPNLAIFQSFDGKAIFHQPRRSFYSGGLALDIEIGGTGNDSVAQAPPAQQIRRLPAILDIPSKRWIFANRRI